MRVSARPGLLLTVFGAVLAVAGGFARWYDATAVYGGRTFELIQATGWQRPNPGLSVLAIGLCVTAGFVALAELLVANAPGDGSPRPLVGLVPIGLGTAAFALVLAKYLARDAYASVGFLVTGSGAALVALGGVLVFWSGVLTRRGGERPSTS